MSRFFLFSPVSSTLIRHPRFVGFPPNIRLFCRKHPWLLDWLVCTRLLALAVCPWLIWLTVGTWIADRIPVIIVLIEEISACWLVGSMPGFRVIEGEWVATGYIASAVVENLKIWVIELILFIYFSCDVVISHDACRISSGFNIWRLSLKIFIVVHSWDPFKKCFSDADTSFLGRVVVRAGKGFIFVLGWKYFDARLWAIDRVLAVIIHQIVFSFEALPWMTITLWSETRLLIFGRLLSQRVFNGYIIEGLSLSASPLVVVMRLHCGCFYDFGVRLRLMNF